MSKKTFRIVAGVTTIVGGAAIAIVTALNVPNAAAINAVIMTVSGAVDEVCSLFIKETQNAA